MHSLEGQILTGSVYLLTDNHPACDNGAAVLWRMNGNRKASQVNILPCQYVFMTGGVRHHLRFNGMFQALCQKIRHLILPASQGQGNAVHGCQHISAHGKFLILDAAEQSCFLPFCLQGG